MSGVPRRHFLLLAAGGAVAACASSTSTSSAGSTACLGAGTGAGLGYCLVGSKTIRISGAKSLEVGQALIVSIDDDSAAILARDGGGFYALSATCTHACCTVTLCGGAGCAAPQRGTPACDAPRPAALASSGAAFLCPCHGSQFDAHGAVLTGPARDPLPAVAVMIEGADAIVDLSRAVPAETRVAT